MPLMTRPGVVPEPSTRRPPAVRLTVGLGSTAEAVALDHAREALALAGGRYVNELTHVEDAHVDLVANLHAVDHIGRHFTQVAQRWQVNPVLTAPPRVRPGPARLQRRQVL